MSLAEQLNDEALVQLIVAGPLMNAQEIHDFLAADDDERRLIITAYKNVGLAPTVSSWDTFLLVLGTIESIAGAVTGIAAAVSGVYSVATL